MKFQYPILLLFALLCFSCQKKERVFDEKKTAVKTIDSLYNLSFSDNRSLTDQIQLTNKAMYLAEKNAIDSLYLKGISNKTYHFMAIFPDSSDYYTNQLIATSKKKNNKKYLAYSYTLKGNSFYNNAQYDSAYYYFKNANVVYFNFNDSLSLAYNQLMMARIHYFYNDYTASEELATQALEYLKKKNNSYVIETYNILGSIYKKSSKYDEAIIYYQKALTLTEKKSLEESYLKNNIASLYIASQEYEKAKHTLYNLLDSELVNNDENLKSAVLLNLGNALFNQDHNDGLEQLIQSLQIRQKAHLELFSIENDIEIANFFALKDQSVATNYLKKALALATKHKNIDNKILALKRLISLNKKNAETYSEEYIRVNDSITSVRNQAKNQFAKMRFDYSKELEQNQVLKSRAIENQLVIQKQKNNQLLLCGIIVFVIIVFYFIYYYIRNKHLKEKITENYKTEQRIAARIHDELANDVYHTLSFAEHTNLSDESNKTKLLDHLEDVYNRTRNISKENSVIPTGKEYVAYLKNLFLEFQDPQVKIITAGTDDFPFDDLDAIKKMVLYRIIQELLVNMKKHSQADLVVLKFYKSNKYAEIQYADDGVGFDKNEKKLKNGLQNVETRIKTIKGSISFDPEIKKGIKIIIRLPL